MLLNIDEPQTLVVSRELAKVLKRLFGKGPNGVNVALRPNIVVVKAEGVLTHIEKNLLQTENGEKVVTALRLTLLTKFKQEMLQELNAALGSTYSEVTAELFVSTDELLLVFC